MTIDTSVYNNGILILIAFAAAFLAALWLSVIFWVLRDIRSRTRDPFTCILSFLLVLILSVPGVLIYWIIRPSKTIEQKYQAALEEEALLQGIEKQLHCPGCGRNVEKEWIICPSCHTRLKKVCVNCGKILDLQWNLCPFCGSQQQKPYNDSNEKN